MLDQQDGGWTEWRDWGSCSATCGDSGFREQTRICNTPLPQHGGADCEGEPIQEEECERVPCPSKQCTNKTGARYHFFVTSTAKV